MVPFLCKVQLKQLKIIKMDNPSKESIHRHAFQGLQPESGELLREFGASLVNQFKKYFEVNVETTLQGRNTGSAGWFEFRRAHSPTLYGGVSEQDTKVLDGIACPTVRRGFPAACGGEFQLQIAALWQRYNLCDVKLKFY